MGNDSVYPGVEVSEYEDGPPRQRLRWIITIPLLGLVPVVPFSVVAVYLALNSAATSCRNPVGVVWPPAGMLLVAAICCLFATFIVVVTATRQDLLRRRRLTGAANAAITAMRLGGLSAHTLAIAIATIGMVLTLSFPLSSDGTGLLEGPSERAFSAIEVFLALYLAVFGIKLFFDKQVSTSDDVFQILYWIASDLEDYKNSDNHEQPVWFCFPALPIGRLRTYLDGKANPSKRGDNSYRRYAEAINSVLDDNKLVVIAYDLAPDEWENFWRVLVTLRADHLRRAKRSVTDEDCNDTVAKLVKDTAALLPTDVTMKCLGPQDNFPPHCVIINDVVYLLMTYGLPRRGPSGAFENTWAGPDDLVDLFCIRVRNRRLAEQSLRHLWEYRDARAEQAAGGGGQGEKVSGSLPSES